MEDYIEIECYELIKLDRKISFVGVEEFKLGFDDGKPSIFSKNEGEDYPKPVASFKSNEDAIGCFKHLNHKFT